MINFWRVYVPKNQAVLSRFKFSFLIQFESPLNRKYRNMNKLVDSCPTVQLPSTPRTDNHDNSMIEFRFQLTEFEISISWFRLRLLWNSMKHGCQRSKQDDRCCILLGCDVIQHCIYLADLDYFFSTSSSKSKWRTCERHIVCEWWIRN